MRGQYYLYMLEVTGLAGPGPAADRAEAAVRPLEAAVPPQVLLLPVLQLLQDLQPGSQSQLSIAPGQLHQSQAVLPVDHVHQAQLAHDAPQLPLLEMVRAGHS